MAKLTRKLMKLFGGSAGANEIGQFGSLAAGTPVYVNDGNVDTIQAAAAWLGGWYDAVVGGNSPAIQDMNGLLYVFAYQLCYLFQSGVPEYSATTTYYTGGFVTDGAGALYYSLQDNNTGNALSSVLWWKPLPTSQPPSIVTVASSPVTPVASTPYEATTSTGAISFQLPNPATISSGFRFTVKDISGAAGGLYPMTLLRYGSELVEGLGASYSMAAGFGWWTWQFDGTNWWLV